jgi:hypothetical protein
VNGVPDARSIARTSAENLMAVHYTTTVRRDILPAVMTKSLVLAAAIVAATIAPVLAHHSFAMYDHTRTVTLKGEVTKFQWTNPHAYLELDVKQKDGTVRHFTCEMTSINMMTRLGWRSNMIKAGDIVSATISPLLNGEPAGLLLDVTLPGGKKLEPGVPAVQTFKRTPPEEQP